MDNLFTKTSKVLRDNWIVELQKSNDFLRNKVANININPFFGYKVKINDHIFGMGQDHIPETIGVIYKIDKSNIWVFYRDLEGKKRLRCFFTRNIEFIDPRFDHFLDNQLH
tara:strand:- start:155 stop:487 length:333 start_codon:yes stop_codon:yes gene_type:complete